MTAPLQRRHLLALALLPAAARAEPTLLPAAVRADPAPVIDWPALPWLGAAGVGPQGLQGVPAVVVFWASWCAYCKRHNVHLDRLYRASDPQRLRVLGVVDATDAAAARQTLAAQRLAFPVAIDDGRLRRQFSSRRVLPLTSSIGADGRRGLVIPGEMTEDDMLQFSRLALPPRAA
jgi:thiol-disulfide isomerase/thioredoxin